jgi:hypothetical protein
MQLRVERHTGARSELLPLFEEAEDSAAQLDSYLDAGQVLVAVDGDRIVGHLQLVDTAETGYAPGTIIGGIELRDRVWLDRDLV